MPAVRRRPVLSWVVGLVGLAGLLHGAAPTTRPGGPAWRRQPWPPLCRARPRRARGHRDRCPPGIAAGSPHRLAREVHDVLAHTLSALSVQLTAVNGLVENGAGAGAVRAAVGRSRRLVVEGVEETRRTVRALRDEPVVLDDQLAAR
ncbi:histidine kinase dimerization/phosphoacceptor domain-containing protein [Streptomyces caniscabiei]|uniref:histidine kinase dimerization/phosphoacceptor domain-containing protein n=1 Tax=Streptomyces TaxID=1883 RepID=UPI00099CCFB1|nr:histidine kinase dimerization/phosphoacceptor domain-containing protein [Streptomyces sp. FxanaA7]